MLELLTPYPYEDFSTVHASSYLLQWLWWN